MHRFKAFKQATFDGLQGRFLGCARNDDTGDAFSKKGERPPAQVWKRLGLFPTYEVAWGKQVLKVQKVHRLPIVREYRPL